MNHPEKIFDALLVLRCQKGDKKSIPLLVKRWHKKLCRQAFYYTKDIDIAKDIAQDSWSVIIRKIHQLKDPNSFGSWVLTITNRKAIDWLRKNKKNEEQLQQYYENSQTNVNRVENNDTTKIILNEIKKLPKSQRIILTLFYVEEYSIREISNILNISKGTIKSRLFYAREKLKLKLKNRNYEEK